MRFAFRSVASLLGLLGTIIALVIDILYSFTHTVEKLFGHTPADKSHFFLGLLVVIGGLIGALLELPAPIVGAILLAVAGIGFFFLVGVWAIFASFFLLLAALLVYLNRGRRRPGMQKAA